MVLQKLNSLESLVEGALQPFNNLKSPVNGIRGEVATPSAKINDFERAVGNMGRSLRFLTSVIEQLKSRVNDNEFNPQIIAFSNKKPTADTRTYDSLIIIYP